MSTDYVERSARIIINRIKGLELAPHAMRLLADGELHEVAAVGIGARASVAGRSHRRAVGRSGMVARVVVGAGLIILAIAYWRADWLELVRRCSTAAWRSSRRCTETAAARSPSWRTGCAAATTASAATFFAPFDALDRESASGQARA